MKEQKRKVKYSSVAYFRVTILLYRYFHWFNLRENHINSFIYANFIPENLTRLT